MSSSKEASGSGARSGERLLNVAVLAQAKRLDVSFLHKLGLHDLDNGLGVGIPYYDRAGDRIAVKLRTRLAAKDGSRWPAKTPLAAYGDWRLDSVAKAGWLILVEGESDCWTLWHHSLPALGLPGANTAKTLNAEHLVGATKLFVHVEQDPGGKAFHDGVLRRLAELNFTGQVFTFHMPAGIKDPSALHIDDPGTFEPRFSMALQTAAPQAPTHLHVQIDDQAGKPGPSQEEETREVCAIRLSDVPEEKVRWLWPGRIPLGKLTILDGDPGLGKSTVTLDIAARLTRGVGMPGCPAPSVAESEVIMLTSEDGAGDTVKPRFCAAKGDVGRLTLVTGIKLSSGTLLPLYFPTHVHDLHRIVSEAQAKLVIIDPLMAYLPESINSASDQSVRQALLPLAQLAETTGAAVMVVRHLNKQSGKTAVYRGGGSIGIIGAARSGLLICKDTNHPHRRYFGVTKCNLCKHPRTIAFEVVDADGLPVIQWQEEVEVSIEDALASEPAEAEEEGNDTDAFLLGRLADGPVPATQLVEEAATLCLSKSSLKRAKKRLRIDSAMIPNANGRGGHWVWRLPPATDSPPPHQEALHAWPEPR